MKKEKKKNGLTVDPLAVSTAQEGNYTGNVRRYRTSFQGAHASDPFLNVFQAGTGIGAGSVMPCVRTEHVSFDTTRRDTVDGDALGAGVGGEGTCETFDGGFGACVEGVIGDGESSGDG